MDPWPKAFEWDYKLRRAFEDACAALVVYEETETHWHTRIKLQLNIDTINAHYVWAEAKRLLNL